MSKTITAAESSAATTKTTTKTPSQNVTNLLTKFEESVQCSICFEMIIPPLITVNCGHNFCEFCINKYQHSIIKKLAEKLKNNQNNDHDRDQESSEKSTPKEPDTSCPNCNKIILHKSRSFTFDDVIRNIENGYNKLQKEDREEAKSYRMDEIKVEC